MLSEETFKPTPAVAEVFSIAVEFLKLAPPPW
jgi:hypothetical protein